MAAGYIYPVFSMPLVQQVQKDTPAVVVKLFVNYAPAPFFSGLSSTLNIDAAAANKSTPANPKV